MPKYPKQLQSPPPTPHLGSSGGAVTRSRARQVSSFDSRPQGSQNTITTSIPPLTPPRITNRYGKRRSHRNIPDPSASRRDNPVEGSHVTILRGPPIAHLTMTPADLSDQFLDELKRLCGELISEIAVNTTSRIYSSSRKGGSTENIQTILAQTLDELVATCDSAIVRSAPLQGVEDQLAKKGSELDQKQTIIDKIFQAREDAMTCGITRDPVDRIYVVSPCGHTFSEEGLHAYFQHSVKQELYRLKDFYKDIVVGSLAPKAFHRRFFLDLYMRSQAFKPVYKCGVCRTKMNAQPVVCSAFLNLNNNLQKLFGLGQSQEPEDTSYACKMGDYFLFHLRNPFSVMRSE